MRVLTSLIVAAAMIATVATPSTATAAPNKLLHYCKHWGAAGLFPDDLSKVKKDPLAALDIQRRNGQILKFPLLYIWKGYELRAQPRVWKQIWDGFAVACPNWPKPKWLQRAQNLRRASRDPLRAQRQMQINALQTAIRQKQAKLQRMLRTIQASPEYQAITGGSSNWHEAAVARAAYLRQIISLGEIRYIVIGKVQRRTAQGVSIIGMAISLKPNFAPGTVTTARQLTVMSPKAGWVRPNGDFLANGVLLQALVNASNPHLIYGPTLTKGRLAQIKAARSDLRKTLSVIRNGKSRIERLLRPATRLQRTIATLQQQLARLSKNR